jgi:hypothetical protein
VIWLWSEDTTNIHLVHYVIVLIFLSVVAFDIPVRKTDIIFIDFTADRKALVNPTSAKLPLDQPYPFCLIHLFNSLPRSRMHQSDEWAQKEEVCQDSDTSYPGQWSSFLFTGQYLQSVLEEAQPIHLITPVSLSNISMIISYHDHFDYDVFQIYNCGYTNSFQVRWAIIHGWVIWPTLHLPRVQRHLLSGLSRHKSRINFSARLSL